MYSGVKQKKYKYMIVIYKPFHCHLLIPSFPEFPPHPITSKIFHQLQHKILSENPSNQHRLIFKMSNAIELAMRRKVDKCLSTAALVFETNKTTKIAAADSVNHTYDDKYNVPNP